MSGQPNKKYRVFIEGPWIAPYAQMFMNHKGANFIGVKKVEHADIVVFTGGADIDPQWYGEEQLPETTIDTSRDARCLDIYQEAHDKIKVGICRGAQFLNVMAGGELWQDVSDHRQSHHIYEVMTSNRIWASSTHHQMMRPTDKARIIATAAKAKVKKAAKEEWQRPDMLTPMEVRKMDPNLRDVEVCAYDHIQALCFQPHPEISGFSELRNFFFNQLGIVMTRARV